MSYASPDLEVARYVVNQLQSAGCQVWFDKEQLQAEENWDAEIRDAVTACLRAHPHLRC